MSNYFPDIHVSHFAVSVLTPTLNTVCIAGGAHYYAQALLVQAAHSHRRVSNEIVSSEDN